MARKYDRVIRYYASWFDDILDPAKEFTDSEFKQIFLAIRDVQLQGSIQPLQQLPVTIRRALSMATMGEQIMRLLERSERMRARGSAGGRAAAAANRTPDQQAAGAIAEQLHDQQRAARRAELAANARGAVSASDYKAMVAEAASGDERALQLLRITQDEARALIKKS